MLSCNWICRRVCSCAREEARGRRLPTYLSPFASRWAILFKESQWARRAELRTCHTSTQKVESEDHSKVSLMIWQDSEPSPTPTGATITKAMKLCHLFTDWQFVSAQIRQQGRKWRHLLLAGVTYCCGHTFSLTNDQQKPHLSFFIHWLKNIRSTQDLNL